MVHQCRVCKKTSRNFPKLSLNPFPANVGSRKEWIDALQLKGPLPKYVQVCTENCLPSDYYLSNNKRYLRKNAIPGLLQFRSGTVAMGLPTDDGSLSDIQPLPKTCQDLNRKSLLRTSSTSGITGRSQGFPSLVNDPKEIHTDSSSSTSTAPSTSILVTKTLSLN